jgi:amino acid adenylation domain-containing protein
MLLHEPLLATARRLPDKVALVAGDERLTFADLDARSYALAARLQARGVRRGDRVAVLLPNVTETVVSAFAAWRMGAVFMPINPQTKATKLAYLLGDATPTCLISGHDLASTWGPASAGVPSIQTIVLRGAALLGSAESGDPRRISFADVNQAGAAKLEPPGTIDLDLAAIMYTSGSTGEPKGVMLTHLNMTTAADSIIEYLGLLESDVVYCALPLPFNYGLCQLTTAFKVGARVVLDASFAFPQRSLALMQRERVSVVPGVPTMYASILGQKALAEFDLGNIRILTNAAAAITAAEITEVRAAFPRARFFSMYGQTECQRVTYLEPDELDRRPTSVGRGMPNEEVYLVDEAGNELPPGASGELVIRGSNVMRGYWRRPDETAEKLRPGRIPGEVVLHTGDIFRTDAEGFLFFVARKDDIIKSRGEKVAPREVEEVIRKHPAVSQVAVIGVPDRLLGEAVRAYVIKHPDAELTGRDVIRHCAANLESFMVPKQVELVTALPLTANGKVSKAELRKAAQASADTVDER